ncbi:bifunctional folylpolyglutamate synthase/dihydrofolate synthase [bacterium]|nr:bifunctional folylpolyglutamate synthase/dihydrofolate synthase [Candidatus Omnitrophota bacterium]MBU2528809.1 bifunctional folylpolyglutamate synthase/dihydrofolate synthase [bacterium]MBU3929076.1 bifunctional folylpolyglutamate synthase/dihydrofolate synthase [bacterium]MBU4123529.1 bifunctional folylpolyglutamate synthase/dihydrofolate synthase [bacterium]
MTYRETLVYLDDLERLGIKPGLSRIKKLLYLLGNPHRRLRVIHIAGTNGKGSTAAFISSILKESGYKTGLYISPHLTDFRERISINGKRIPSTSAARILTECKTLAARRVRGIKKPGSTSLEYLTYFEIVTAAAFSHFAREKVDFAVVETGMGGRWDATNVVKPLISVITNSDYDHMDILGANISSIAAEHAGIIKKGAPVITASSGKALQVIKKVCRQRNTRLFHINTDINYEFLKSDLKRQSFNIYPAGNNGENGVFSEFKNLTIPLLGKYQLTNACCAVAAIELLRAPERACPRGKTRKGGVVNAPWRACPRPSELISDESIRKGLSKTRWPGRLEIVNRSPLVILDGAHNLPAAKQLRKALLEFLGNNKRLILVLGILKDKEVGKIVRELVPLAFKVIVTSSKTSRAVLPDDLYKIAVKYNRNVSVISEVEEALQYALCEAKKNDIVCITGSLYTVGEARRFFAERRCSDC